MDTIQELFLRDGFILIPNGIGPSLLAKLRGAVEPLIDLRGRGTSSDTRHQTLLEPKSFRPAYLEFLNLHSLNRSAERMLGTDELSFAGLALLLGQSSHGFCKWHRDFRDENPELSQMLREPQLLIQFNCALYDDRSLWIVPGSHVRATRDDEKTVAERQWTQDLTGAVGAASNGGRNPLSEMPGSINVVLEAGDCLLYNPILWHSAEYRPEWKRATLHGGWRKTEAQSRFLNLRWGFHHNPWLMEPGYLGELGPYFGPQLERYLHVARRWAQKPQLATASAS